MIRLMRAWEFRLLLTAGNTVEDFKNARTRSLTGIDIMISIIPGSVFKVKKSSKSVKSIDLNLPE